MDSVYEGSVVSEGDESIQGGAGDPRITWLAAQVLATFKLVNPTLALEFLEAEEFLGLAQRFVTSGPIGSCLYVWESSGGRLFGGEKRPNGDGGPKPRRVLAFTRTVSGEMHVDEYSHMTHQVLVSDGSNPLMQVEKVTRAVVLPVMRLASSASGVLPGVIAKEVTENLRALLADTQVVLGQTEGNTRLPLPVDPVPSARRASFAIADSLDLSTSTSVFQFKEQATSQDKIHAYESSVITWVRGCEVFPKPCCAVTRSLLPRLRVCVADKADQSGFAPGSRAADHAGGAARASD